MFLTDCGNSNSSKRYSNVKKLICLILVLLNMLVYLPVNTYAAGEKIIVGEATWKPDKTVEVPVYFSGLKDSGIQYFEFDLKYSSNFLKYSTVAICIDEVLNNTDEKYKKDCVYNEIEAGTIKFAYNTSLSHFSNINSNIVFAKFIFTIREGLQIKTDTQTDINIELKQVPNNYRVTSFSVQKGVVTISAPQVQTPTPKPTSTSTSTPTHTPTSAPTPIYVNGLNGEYKGDNNLVVIKRDEFINFSTYTNPPLSGPLATSRPTSNPLFGNKDIKFIKWTGYFVPQRKAVYKFHIISRDRYMLFFTDGQNRRELIVKNWDNESFIDIENHSLEANQKYKIELEFEKVPDNANIALLYSISVDGGYTFSDQKVIVTELQCEDLSSPTQSTPTPTQSTPTPTKTTPTPTKATTTATSTKATTTATATPKVSGTPTPTATATPYVAPYIPPAPSNSVLQPVPTVPQTIPSDLSLALSSDKATYDSNQNIVFTIHYRNRLATEVSNVKLSSDIPANTTYVESSGGIVAGNKITWDLGALKGNQEGTVKYTVKVDSFDGADKETVINANITSTNSKDNTEDDNKSILKILLYAKKAALGSHKKYINGYPDNTFRPEKPITRAEISSIIARVLNLDLSSDEQIFTDVGKSHWAFKEVNAATKSGFFKGASPTKFKPNAFITKGELAAVICRCLGMEESSIAEEDFFFSDTKDDWSGKYVEELYRSKIVVGSGGKFYPTNQIKRAEAITMINKMLFRGPLSGKTLQFADVPADHWAYGQIAEAVFDHKYSKDPKGGEKYEEK